VVGAVLGAVTALPAAALVAACAAALVAAPLLVLRPVRRAAGRAAGGAALRLAAVERARMAACYGVETATRSTPLRAFGYVAARAPVGLLGAMVLAVPLVGGYLAVSPLEALDGNDVAIVPVGLMLVYVGVQGTVGLVGVERALARWVLGPSRQDLLEQRVAELTESRAGVVEAVDEERRRIERDLHDGVQQRLVALAMLLGRARRGSDPERSARLLRDAHDESRLALDELREVAWRVYPATLDELGLRAALAGLAERCPVPVAVEYGLSRRPGRSTETAVYFAVREAVTNAVKHSGAERITVDLAESPDGLTVQVTDDGAGGADPAGTGLSGIARRVAALDGVLSVTSPPGGPTAITVTLPATRPRAAESDTRRPLPH
jgi:signal transduction histidine kinase